MAWTALFWIGLNLVLVGVLFGVTGHHYHPTKSCSWHLMMWPFVLGAFHFFLVLFFIGYLVASLILAYRRLKFVRWVMNLLALGLFLNFWIAWLVYGNIIIYKRAWGCRY